MSMVLLGVWCWSWLVVDYVVVAVASRFSVVGVSWMVCVELRVCLGWV